MQVGNSLIHQVQTQRTGKNTGDGEHQTVISAVFHSRKNQTQYRCGQHHACRKGQNNIAEFVGNILEYKADQAAQHRGTANAQGSQ